VGQLLDTKKGLPGTAAENHPEDSPCQQDRQAYIVGQVLFFWPVTSTIFFFATYFNGKCVRCVLFPMAHFFGGFEFTGATLTFCGYMGAADHRKAVVA